MSVTFFSPHNGRSIWLVIRMVTLLGSFNHRFRNWILPLKVPLFNFLMEHREKPRKMTVQIQIVTSARCQTSYLFQIMFFQSTLGSLLWIPMLREIESYEGCSNCSSIQAHVPEEKRNLEKNVPLLVFPFFFFLNENIYYPLKHTSIPDLTSHG